MYLEAWWQVFGDRWGGTILHPQYFAKRIEKKWVEEVRRAARGKVVVDVGCGRQWYSREVSAGAKNYWGFDYPNLTKDRRQLKVDFWADAQRIPIKSSSVEVVLMGMVWEHLADPEAALRQVRRILKTNGMLVISTVQNYPGHELPGNYYGCTRYGLREMLERCGFRVRKAHSRGNFWETQVTYSNVYWLHVVQDWLQRQPIAGVVLLLLVAVLAVAGNILAVILGRRLVDERYALGHVMLATATGDDGGKSGYKRGLLFWE